MIDIVDTGVGIAPENIEKLFLDFSKLDEHAKINEVGTGLGQWASAFARGSLSKWVAKSQSIVSLAKGPHSRST